MIKYYEPSETKARRLVEKCPSVDGLFHKAFEEEIVDIEGYEEQINNYIALIDTIKECFNWCCPEWNDETRVEAAVEMRRLDDNKVEEKIAEFIRYFIDGEVTVKNYMGYLVQFYQVIKVYIKKAYEVM